MGFGLFYLPIMSEESTASAVYDAILDEVAVADRLGWDIVWISEHHFDAYGGVIASTALFGTAIAMRTKRIRIGAGVALLPLRNCLQLAEEFAMLDVLSHGRVELGVGLGFVPHEFRSFGVPMETRQERFEEGLTVLRKAWLQERFSYKGNYYDLADVSLYPRPAQRPHPPIWLAAARDQHAYEVAGQSGLNLMINPYTRTNEEVRTGLHKYREAYKRAGHDPTKSRVLAHFHLYVAPNEDEVYENAREAFQSYLRTQDRALAKASDRQAETHPSVDKEIIHSDRFMFGTPEMVECKIRAWIALGVTDFCFATQFGNMPLEFSIPSLQLFSEKIIPLFGPG